MSLWLYDKVPRAVSAEQRGRCLKSGIGNKINILLIVHGLNARLDVHRMNALRGRLSQLGGGRVDRLLRTEQENERIVLSLLSSVETDGERSQRRIAAELGIALGLVNAYLKRCIRKGLVKVYDAPARRYAYYLTPQGFAEKSRLTVQYLSDSFSFFRMAKGDCARVFEQAKASGYSRLVLAGRSDLAEVAILCAVEAGVVIVAVVDPGCEDVRFVGVEVSKNFSEVKTEFDAVVVTDVSTARASFDAAVEVCGADRVLAPALLGLRPGTKAVESGP
jgi:DNA-binding MarR family transcriptional regulator